MSKAIQEKEPLVIVEFLTGYAYPGGPGYNAGDKAAFTLEDAETIVTLGAGRKYLPASKSLAAPPTHKMMTSPSVKKTVREKFA